MLQIVKNYLCIIINVVLIVAVSSWWYYYKEAEISELRIEHQNAQIEAGKKLAALGKSMYSDYQTNLSEERQISFKAKTQYSIALKEILEKAKNDEDYRKWADSVVPDIIDERVRNFAETRQHYNN